MSRMSFVRPAVAGLALAWLALPLPAQVHPNHVQGFEPEKLYQMDGIENVNVFNGNLTLTIPLGQSYPVGGQLSYGLTLVYSGNVWEWEEVAWAEGSGTTYYLYGQPRKRSNAGLGWTLSLGRLNPPRHDPAHSVDEPPVYESPDGASHELFSGGLHGQLGAGDGRSYSRDSTYIRYDSGSRKIETADGLIRTFDTTDRLTRLEDRHGNFLNVTYPPSATHPGVDDWLLTDGHGRSHRIYFMPAIGLDTVVQKVELATFGSTKATYDFTYQTQTIARGYSNADLLLKKPDDAYTSRVAVPLLTEVALPDGSTYEMDVSDYDWGPAAPNTSDLSGHLLRMKLPTGGFMEWDWTTYFFPTETGSWVGLDPNLNPDSASLKNPFHKSVGLSERRHKSASGGLLGRWIYSPEIDSSQMQHKVTVTDDLLGHPSVYYFSVYAEKTMPPSGWPAGGWTLKEYGLPFTRYQSDGTSPGRYLSAELKRAGGTVERKVYVRYERDGDTEANPRVASERTVYVTDGNKYADVTYSNFDGLGHYRQVSTDGNFPGQNVRTTFTNYNPGSCATCTPSTGTPWVLGTFTYQDVTESGVTARTEACFNGSTGFLDRTRTLKNGTAPSANDLLTRYEQVSGNVTQELHFGGDTQGLGTGGLCGLALSAPQYQVVNTYQYGTLASSQYTGMQFKSVDRVIDQNTGKVKTSKDTSDLVTTYEYDTLGRPSWIKPAQESWTQYGYNVVSGTTTQAKVWIYRRPNGGGGLLGQEELHFDGLGRVVTERRKLADGTFSTRDTVYDGAGNVYSKTEWGSSAKTIYGGYDPFGRPATITPPDGSAHQVTLAYDGVREVRRTVNVGTSWDGASVLESPVTTREIYDRHGRLYQVVEPANPNGTDSTTTYTYDVGNRLHLVQQTAKNAAGSPFTQTRTFDYDRRGFLTSEQHPEKGGINGYGTVTYSGYDALGNPGRVIDGPSDLTYTYDALGRVTRIRETGSGFSGCQTSWSSGPRCLKEFVYATDNGTGDYRRGKLQTSKRYNYPVLGTTTYTGIVNQTYTYGGKQGRVSARETSLTFGGSTTERFNTTWAWNDLGDVASIGYPQCAFPQYCTATQPRTVSSSYSNGFLTAVPGYVSSITYHPNAQVNLVNRMNGTTDTHIQDLQSMQRPRKIFTTVTSSGVVLWNSGAYSFDGAGNVTNLGNAYFTYDQASRVRGGLLHLWAGGGGTTASFDHAYDGFGNLQSLTTNSSTRATPTSHTTNRLTGSVSYDTAGNLTYWNGNTYQYDRFHQMTRMAAGSEIWLYMYDADDERVWSFKEGASPRFDRWTIRDLDGKVLRTYEATNYVWSWKEDHVYRGSTALASVTPSGTTHLHTDHLGTIRAQTNTAATPQRTSYHVYYPFGEEATPIQNLQRMKFTGHERDLGYAYSQADDLDYMHARHYNPQVGRFLSIDPVGGNARVPQSWNRYSYVLGNPMKYIDPYGLFPCPGMPEIECQEAITVTAELPELGGFVGFLGFGSALRNLQLFDGPPSTGFGLFDVQTAQQFYRTGFEAAAEENRNAQAFLLFAVDELFVPDTQAELGIEIAMAVVPGGKAGQALTKSFKYAVKTLGVNAKTASKALHAAKRAAGRGGADNVLFDTRSGDIIAPETGEIIGNLADGY